MLRKKNICLLFKDVADWGDKIKAIVFFLILLIMFSLFLGCVGVVESNDSSITDQNVTSNDLQDDNPLSGTCPMGKVDELCTGECGNFVDNDNDGYCDRSQ